MLVIVAKLTIVFIVIALVAGLIAAQLIKDAYALPRPENH
jgi:hypothetical protein